MATAAARVDVRARGVGPLLLCAAAAFLVGSFLLGVLVGPVHIGVGGILGSMGDRLRLPGVSSSLSPTEDSILWDIRIPRVVLGALVDVLSLGDDEAATLGVNVKRVRLVLVVAATVGTAAAVAVSGLIGFVGIIVPHAIRLVSGVGYRVLPPLSAVVGAGFLVLADVIARTALSPAEIPLGIVTAFFGAPFFALVLR